MHKPIRIAMLWALVAALAAAQSAPAKASGKTAPASTAAAKPSAPAAKSSAQPALKHSPAAMKTSAKSAAKAGTPAAVTKTGVTPPGKRDPFVNPVKTDSGGTDQKCTTGPKCLIIAQVVLKGTIKTREGMIAMVENAAKKAYNLHEKDEVVNGFVLKITGDSIVFRETVRDLLGNMKERDVVKRVTVPAI